MIVIEVLFGIYIVALAILLMGWRKMENKTEVFTTPVNFSATILVPFRNEEQSLPKLLASLVSQKYTGNWEVILINDHSDDSSVNVVQRFIESHRFASMVLTDASSEGKKHALNAGIALAKGEIIITTDADCVMGPNWLQSMVDAFAHDQVNMVAGPVRIKSDKSFWSQMQQLEFASVIGTSGATLAYNLPTMCNGANLAFRKSIFFQVGGYESNFDIASGDDEFLLKKIRSLSDRGIVFNFNRSSIVTTSALPSLRSFVSQRIRWAGKWKFSDDLLTKVLAVGVFGFHLAVLALVMVLILDPTNFEIPALLLIGKITVELVFLRKVSSWLNNKWSWLTFLAWQLLYPFYSLFIGVASLISGYTWKNRRYHAFAGS